MSGVPFPENPTSSSRAMMSRMEKPVGMPVSTRKSDAVGRGCRDAEGQLTARNADAEGRIFGFSYRLERDHDLVRMWISGRGGWHPAPGVVFRAS